MSLYMLGLIALATAWVTWKVVYNVFFSPLRSIPGPFLAKITPQWLTIIDMAGYRTITIHRLHQKYGSSVRIGPNEVSYSNPDIVKELYSQQTQFMKAPSYETFVVPPVGIFSMRDKAAHSQRRRLLSHAFSQSNLYDTEPIIGQIISKLVAHLEGRLGKSTDMLLWFRLTAFDIVGELFLGQSSGGLEKLEPPRLLEDIDRFFIIGGIAGSFPWLVRLLHLLPIPAVWDFLGAKDRIVQYGRSSFNNYIDRYGRDSGRRDLLTKIVANKTAEEAPMTDDETYIEISNLVFAGSDTTSTTLTYLFWELARFPEWQMKLHSEISHNIGWTSGLPNFKDISELPILDAVINEALRLHPAAPASLPRETPVGGRMLNNVFIPEKTIVSMQCYTTQRDPRVFSNAGTFLPERWLGPEVISPEAKALYMPFSSGTRACLGKNLAMMELKLITSTLIKQFDVSLAPDTTEGSMFVLDHFLAIPKSGKCNLIFTKHIEQQ
ncbi:uncharacterized protein A1O9_02191 [Exophiala aquamarina CBS 119918]|uniref:Cytochrome P450 oxidoreductase n=1 Tax=Exophiala aquamarina CBS 119918 TaxID=1182545 RepID=A0A072PYD4_9EURO|nr:uncharacterized protein A1O9_02191 [Exophiala aquamarina CBS 119918]KEF60630.1 hypothetical protein A1O9_02191 [Exophiala aquamarina CBS 119918]